MRCGGAPDRSAYLKVRVTWSDGRVLDWRGHALGGAAWDGRVRCRWVGHASMRRQAGTDTAGRGKGESEASKARATLNSNGRLLGFSWKASSSVYTVRCIRSCSSMPISPHVASAQPVVAIEQGSDGQGSPAWARVLFETRSSLHTAENPPLCAGRRDPRDGKERDL